MKKGNTKSPAPKKRATRSSSSKKTRATKKESRASRGTTKTRTPVVAYGEQCFWVKDGPVLCSIVDLEHALETMSDEQFSYHTKRDGNDFAAWVSAILRLEDCARKMSRASSRAGMLKIVRAHI